MKLKSKNSFLKRISCIALSLMLCLTSFTLAGFAPTLEAEAATSKEVLHYTFDNGTRYDVNGQNQLTEAGWGSSSSGTDYYCNSDGGVHGSIVGLNGLNNWTLTYVGRSIQNLDSSKQEGSCEIGLGTTQGNTDVIRISSYGHIYYNGTKLAQANVVSAGINTIEIEYKINALIVRVNSVSYGPYTVDASLFSSVNYLYSGLDSGITIGSHEHYIYDIVATTVDDTCVTKADFETAFTNFENKINGTLYTNIKPAYDAYVNARKVYDAYYYGNDIALTNISDALLELEAQTAKLTTEWQSPTGTAVPLFEGGSVTKTEAYSNLLYSNKINDRQNTEANAGKYDKTYVYNRIGYNQTVMLYDGKNQPKMPVVFVTLMQLSDYHIGTKYRYPYIAYPTSGSNTTDKFSDLYLEDKWYYKESYSGSNESSCWNFNNIFGQINARVGNGPTSLQAGAEMSKYGSGWTNLFPYTNVLVYNNQKVFENDDTGAYSKKYNLWWVFGDEASGKTSIDQLKLSRCQVDDNSAIYVVNYQPLRKLIEESTTNIPNSLINVKQGGLSTYLDTLNTLMSYNPNSSFSGVSSVTDGISNFNSAMTTNMTKASDMEKTITNDNSAYDTIRTEIVNYKTILNNKSYDGHSLNDYTDKSKEDYTKAYNNAVKYMALVDNNGYDLTTTEPKNIADTLTNARTGLTLKSFTIKFKYVNGDTTKGDKYTIYTKGTSVKVPANSKVDYDDNYHYSYSWPTIEDVTADKTYEEIKTPIGHTLSETPVSDYQTGNYYDENISYTHSYNCSDCEYVNKIDCTFENQGINDDTATVACSVCHGTYTLDLEAYNKAVADANTSINNTVAYTSDSINALSLVLSEQAAKLNSAKTQDDVDSCTTTIISKNKLTTADSAGVLVLNQYAITLHVVDEDGQDLRNPITYAAVDYGTVKNISVPDEYKTNYSVIKWTRESAGDDVISGLNSSSLDVVVKGDSKYYVFLRKTTVDATKVDDNAVIKLNNKSGNVADIGYVPMSQNETETTARVTFDTTAGTIKIGDTTLTAPIYSFYTLKGFYINGVLYSESGIDVAITKNTVITPFYDASLFVNINRASGESFTINNENIDLYPAKWNQKVTLKSETEVYWYNENNVLLGKGTTYSFYANSNVTIHTAPVVSEQNVDPTASIGYFAYDSTLNKVTVVNNFFVPDRKTVTEAGVILSTKNSTVDALKKQTNGIFKGGPESFTSTGNQIRISVSRTANTPFTMYALAYVVVDGTTYYANEVKTINYTPQSA